MWTMTDITRTLGIGVAGASDLFQLLRDGSPRTRAELATITGLSRSTIATRIDGLMRLGLVAPVRDGLSTGGRPPSQFALDPKGRIVIAADLGASHSTIAVTDLAGTILQERREPLDIASGPEPVLQHMLETANSLIGLAGRDRADVIAVGIGLPGPVEFTTGRPSNPPIMPGWDGFDVPGWVQHHIPVPVHVENDVNIMALGERALFFPDVGDVIFVKVATGIGAGVVSGGRLQRGAQGTAGDIGHVRVERGMGIACPCGNIGCLEALASGPAIATTLRGLGLDARSGSDVLELVRQGNTQAIQAVRQAGRDIGEVLTTCISFINPSVIVIGGSMAQAGEHLLAGVREVVYTRSTPLSTEHLSIVQSRAGASAAVTGAGALSIQHALSPEGIDSLVAA
jgi:predicted NBD/HSP70 family sugar kinase